MITLRQIQFALAVARHKHFKRAAEECNISQSALSLGIAEMEKNLGVIVFERNNKQVVITPIGEELLRRAQQIYLDAQQLVEHAHAGDDGDSGNAETFARFLDEELPPLLAARIPIDRSQQSLFGHSYGGLFALYHLYTRGTMRGYYLSSPSIWWENRRIDAFADRYHAPANRLTIRISAGSGEQAAPATKNVAVARW